MGQFKLGCLVWTLFWVASVDAQAAPAQNVIPGQQTPPIECDVRAPQFCPVGTICESMIGACLPSGCLGQLQTECPMGFECVIVPFDGRGDLGVPSNVEGGLAGVGECRATRCGAEGQEACPAGFACQNSRCLWLRALRPRPQNPPAGSAAAPPAAA